MLREPAGEGAPGDADFFGDFGLAEVEPLGEQNERLDGEALANQLGQGAAFIDRSPRTSSPPRTLGTD